MRKSCVVLHVEVGPGSNISDAIRDAIAMAARTGAVIAFDFNGVQMVVHEHSDDQFQHDYYQKSLALLSERAIQPDTDKMQRLIAFVRRVAYEPIGPAEASDHEILDMIESEAKAILEEIEAEGRAA